jgi:hypothetical protein
MRQIGKWSTGHIGGDILRLIDDEPLRSARNVGGALLLTGHV